MAKFGKSYSMMNMCCIMLLSLAVATLTLFQVMARVFRDEDADDASWSSMVVQTGGGSVQRIPVRN